MSGVALSVVNAARDLKLKSSLGAALTLREEVYVSDLNLAGASALIKNPMLISHFAPALRGEPGPPGRIGVVTATVEELPPGSTTQVHVTQTDDGVDLAFAIPTPNNARLVTNASNVALQAGQPVAIVSGGGIVPANAADSVLFNVAGLVLSDNIQPSATGYIIVNGILKLSLTVLWDQVAIGSAGGLVSGTQYYLDWNNPGKISTAFPEIVGYYLVPLGVALSPTELEIQLGYNIKL